METTIIFDSTGRPIGKEKDYVLFNMKGKKICEVNPKTKVKQIVKILLLKSLKYGM